ncbi:pilus assembly protein PilY [Variovorax boronicumulans]|uniref:Pilus assembly protein PilY n=1 Tax=Variovorax boronicumulans TaxID=436515 RepID=A0A250DTJ5_9BURK|nr:PilC/PilY family type IV pilus protein [Variovorax boronicumulans]ATA57411.1 pilus assembly protein PilY [Variovorax boronicumulans]
MTNRSNPALDRKYKRQAICCAVMVCALLLGSFAPVIEAAPTDLSNQPLATLPAVQAKPNLLFVLDDSGSMDSDYMPDEMSNGSGNGRYGYRSAQCNGVAYDPLMTYAPPLNADGTSYPNAVFTAARVDGYDTSSGTTNLNNRYYYTYSGTQPKMGWVYTSSGAVRNTFYNECRTSTDSSSGVFTLVTVTSASNDAQNYANWYSYYRKRYLLMRTAMGRAISVLDSSYRVGFSTISDGTAVDGSNYFRDVKDFDSDQKANFYSSLYNASPNGWTPLRAALSKAGRYFANKAPDQSYDPVQYSCQRNYALLSTDGYWNKAKGLKLNGTSEIGQQDGSEDRPMRDDTQVIITTVTPYTVALTQNALSSQTHTRDWTRTSVTVSATPRTSGSNRGKYLVTTRTNQRYTETQTLTRTTPQSAIKSYTETVVTTDGVETSRSTSPHTTSAWINTATPTESFTGNGPPTASSSFTNGTSSPDTYQTAQGSGQPEYSNPVSGPWSAWSTPPVTSNSTPVAQPPVAGAPTRTPSTSGGTGNTLADVAQYYFATDLRTSALGNCTSNSSGSNQDVCSNIVRPVGNDKAAWQHMNSFTIGLGVSGTLPYDKNYLTQTAGTYVNLTNGTLNWPVPEGADLNNGEGGNATNVDDLWHAAVNGRGQYYSALDAGALSEAINGVVTSVQQVAGSGATASTSSLQLVAGDNNLVFRASYTTQLWTGDLQAFSINGSTGVIASTATWSAQAKLDATTPSSRKIYFSDGSALRSFEYGNLSAAQKGYFDNLCGQSLIAAQCSQLSASNKTLANNGTNLVNYLRGVRTHESASVDASNTNIPALYRKRDHVLGDIINGAPVHVGKPPFRYADAGYADFVAAKAARTPVVYVGSNDGMLHAFSAATNDTGGTELWAYVPSAVMPNLYKMADTSYGSKHQYSVDGAPVMGDIKVGTTWKTIVVGGLNSGGRGYYALDITDPNDPKALWEFTDANLGLSFGNPVIAKRSDGTWIVTFASGYNNADGKGHLYVLNANTGALLLDIATSDGSSTDPSGLAKINAWIESTSDNTAKRFYGGDLQGNLWRFDIDALLPPNRAAMRLAKFQVDASTPQPITTKPETVEISGRPVVVVATGRYLGATDITDSTQQSIYAVRDTLTATGWSDVRADTANFVRQTFTLNGPVATATAASVSNTAVNWSTKGGWWIDLPHSRERVNTNLGLQYSTLSIATAIPNGDACASGGTAWRYYLNVANGGVVTTNPAGGLWSTDGLIMGMTWVQDSNGNARIIYQKSNGDNVVETPPVATSSGSGSVHRTSWRELVD